jgi:hypothetical protein
VPVEDGEAEVFFAVEVMEERAGGDVGGNKEVRKLGVLVNSLR